MAVALELPGADRNATFDENLMRVLRWLREFNLFLVKNLPPSAI